MPTTGRGATTGLGTAFAESASRVPKNSGMILAIGMIVAERCKAKAELWHNNCIGYMQEPCRRKIDASKKRRSACIIIFMRRQKSVWHDFCLFQFLLVFGGFWRFLIGTRFATRKPTLPKKPRTGRYAMAIRKPYKPPKRFENIPYRLENGIRIYSCPAKTAKVISNSPKVKCVIGFASPELPERVLWLDKPAELVQAVEYYRNTYLGTTPVVVLDGFADAKGKQALALIMGDADDMPKPVKANSVLAKILA